MVEKKEKIAAFQRLVWAHYKKHGRHTLLWRKSHNLYRILVSEVMLQQTQVDRVIPFYRAFLKQFPTQKKLAEAPLSSVLAAWQGLGYNRRAKMLHEAAKEMTQHGVPKDVAGLEKLPGVGPYTARAVAAFAWNSDGIVVETNIRTAVIHHFFQARENVSDKEIEKVLLAALPKGRAREWYAALMDYGASLKRDGVSHNTRVKGYAKQSQFKGSLREARGAILRELAKKPASRARLLGLLGDDRASQLQTALERLCEEKFVTARSGRYQLAP